jgi:translation initiation factor IF-2
MPGFLATLVARAEGQLPLLERRPRALFEPAVDAPAAPLATMDTRPGRGAAPAAPPPRAVEARMAPHRETGEPPPSPPIGHTPPGLSQAAGVPLAPRADSPVRPEAEHGALLVALPAAHPTARAADVPAPTARTSADASREEPPPVLQRAGPLREPVPVVVPAARPVKEPAPPSGALQHRATSSTLGTVARARDPGVGSSRHAMPAAAAPLPAPVQISIGRVEIRAVQAAADRPRATGPAAPKLSLDDYLRGRSGTTR